MGGDNIWVIKEETRSVDDGSHASSDPRGISSTVEGLDLGFRGQKGYYSIWYIKKIITRV